MVSIVVRGLSCAPSSHLDVPLVLAWAMSIQKPFYLKSQVLHSAPPSRAGLAEGVPTPEYPAALHHGDTLNDFSFPQHSWQVAVLDEGNVSCTGPTWDFQNVP